jgi:hypothetical protein
MVEPRNDGIIELKNKIKSLDNGPLAPVHKE